MSSCVPSPIEEQNELVVRTGLELRLRRLDVDMMKDKNILVIDSSKHFNANMCHVINTIKKPLYNSGIPYSSIHFNMPTIRLFGSILDIPKEQRSKGIIICFDETTYNGRQCLYHLFGEKLGLKPYQVFVEAMEKTQKNGDAIVFSEEEIMWFSGPKPEFSAEEISKFVEIPFALIISGKNVYSIESIPDSIQAWIRKTYPETKYVNIQIVEGKDHIYEMCGWSTVPLDYAVSLKANWQQTIKGVKKKVKPQLPIPLPLQEKNEVVNKQDYEKKAELAAILGALKALTDAVTKLVAKY